MPYCYGELALKPWEIEKLCPIEISYMLDGWQRRYERLEDLFIAWAAYPQYKIANPKRCPPLSKFFMHRKRKETVEEKKKTFNEIMEEFEVKGGE